MAEDTLGETFLEEAFLIIIRGAFRTLVQKLKKLLVNEDIYVPLLSQACQFNNYPGLLLPYFLHDLRLVMNLMFNVVNVVI